VFLASHQHITSTAKRKSHEFMEFAETVKSGVYRDLPWFFTFAALLCLNQSINQSINQSSNQSINLFVQKYNKHWTGHQGRIQTPPTGARKNNINKSNKWQYL